MKKKLISLSLLAGMLMSAMTGCSLGGNDEIDEDDLVEQVDTRTTTISLTAITGENTTAEAIAAVQDAMNALTKKEYKTQVILQLKTADEYEEFVASQIEKIEAEEAAAREAAAKKRAEEKAKKEAEQEANKNKKKRSKWVTTTKAPVESTEPDTQEMETDEYGREVAAYPELEGTSLDILFITDYEMLVEYAYAGYLQPLDNSLESDSKMLNKYIYPTILQSGQVDGVTYAIPNNHVIGEYTYLLVDKELADKYGFDAASVTALTDCEVYLDAVKAGEADVMPINTTDIDVPYLLTVAPEVSFVGTIISSDFDDRSKMIPQLLFEDPRFVNHEALVDKLEQGGYAGEADRYALEVRSGYITTPEDENWEENYYVIELEKPVCTHENIYRGMFAVSSYASDLGRCMEIITMINTNPALRNTYAFGVEGVNYELNENGTVHMLNDDWSMDFFHSGNTLIGAAPETLPVNYGEIGVLQNNETIVSPYYLWYYENEVTAPLLDQYLTTEAPYVERWEASGDKVTDAATILFDIKRDFTSVINKLLKYNNIDGFVSTYLTHYDNYFAG